MPPPLVELAVTRIVQKPGLCGAATAQMILHFTSMVGTTQNVQLALWAKIQANTNGNRPAAAVNPHDCPAWPTQLCDKCAGEQSYTCWCTYPDALRATLTAEGQAVTLSAPFVDTDAAALILRSIDANFPPAVLVKAGLHWLAVAGYQPGDNGVGRQIDGRFITHIYVRDPASGATNHEIAIDTWMDDYLAPVIQCGLYRNYHPVIVAAAQAPAEARAPETPQNLRIVP
jgi:hypothetical protein